LVTNTDMTTLKDEILAKCSQELIDSKEHGQIAAIVSVGRTKFVEKRGGIGTIMSTLGATAGAALLDTMESLSASNSAVKWGMRLVNAGELDFGDAQTRAMFDQLLPAEAATALKSLAEVSNTVTVQQVIDALKE
jgi:hypothetical protein